MPALGSYALTRFMGACYLQDELNLSVRRPFCLSVVSMKFARASTAQFW
jgi:hypothetical protein